MSSSSDVEPAVEPEPGPAFRDPFGPDPEGIPDPMPDDLQTTGTVEQGFEDEEPMEGDAPTG